MIQRVYRYRGFDITAKYYGDKRQNIIIAERSAYPACAIFGRDMDEIKKDIDNVWREFERTGSTYGH